MDIQIRAGKIEDLEQIQKLSQLLFIKEQKNTIVSTTSTGHSVKKASNIFLKS